MIFHIGWTDLAAGIDRTDDYDAAYASVIPGQVKWLTRAPWLEPSADHVLERSPSYNFATRITPETGALWTELEYRAALNPSCTLSFSITRRFASSMQAARWIFRHARPYPATVAAYDDEFEGDPLPTNNIGLIILLTEDDATVLTSNAAKLWSHGAMLSLASAPRQTGIAVTCDYVAYITRLDEAGLLSVARDEDGKFVFTGSDYTTDFVPYSP